MYKEAMQIPRLNSMSFNLNRRAQADISTHTHTSSHTNTYGGTWKAQKAEWDMEERN